MRGTRRDHSSKATLFDRETGSVRKKWKDKLPVALVFPNSYYLGMSNLGFQLVYSLLNAHDDIVCERLFYESGVPPRSVESNRPLGDFPVVMVSVSFEQDFPNLVAMLAAGGVEPLAERRSLSTPQIEPGAPLVVGGGVATFINPEPLAPFIDLFICGEFEPIADDFIEALLRISSYTRKDEMLSELAQRLSGIYVPSLYEPLYDDGGRIREIRVSGEAPTRVKRLSCAEKSVAGHSTILTSETEFSEIHLTELGRGCSRSCRFCAAGYVYRRPRLWSPEAVIAALGSRSGAGGRVGLLGMEMASPTDIETISSYLLAQNCSLSFSSLRADMIKGPLLDLLKASHLKTAVIAPDGGSERLRRVINKGITAQDCLTAAQALAEADIANLKMYFMIGLPTEEAADLVEMVQLVGQIQEAINEIGRRKKRLPQIHLSINSFVPKAWTPFQFHSFEAVERLKEKIDFLRTAFGQFNNLKLRVDHPDAAYFQAVLSRGDRRVGRLLPEIARSPRRWKKILMQSGIDPVFYAQRRRDASEIFPWEIIDHGIDREFLWREYQRGLAAKISPSCGSGLTQAHCRKCGVCQ